jgi:uncharacterized membrane protein
MDRPSRYFWLVVVLIVIGGAAPRFYDLGGPSLWLDEVFTNLYARAPAADTLAYLRDDASLTPFYFLSLHAYPTGSDAWLRSFSALMGTLSILLFIVAVERLYDDRWLALWAGALLAVNAYAVWLSHTARMYTLTLLLVIIVSYCFLAILKRQDTRWTWIMFIAASSAAYVTHYFTAMLPIVQYVVLGAVLRRRRSLFRQWVIAQAIAVIPLLFWFAYLIAQGHARIPIAWIREPRLKDIAYTIFDMTIGYTSRVPWYAFPGLIAALIGMGAGAVYAARRYRAEPARWYWFGLVAGTLGMVCIASYLITPLYVDRYFVVFLPGLILLILQGWQGLLRPYPRALLNAVVALIFLTGAAATLIGLYDKIYYKEDWRGAAAYIDQHSQPGDGVVTGQPIEMLALQRYAGPEPLSYTWLEEPDQETMQPFTSPVNRLWVVVHPLPGNSHQSQTVFSHLKAGFAVTADQMPPWLLERQDQIVETKTFNGLALFRLDTQP